MTYSLSMRDHGEEAYGAGDLVQVYLYMLKAGWYKDHNQHLHNSAWNSLHLSSTAGFDCRSAVRKSHDDMSVQSYLESKICC